MKRLAEKLKSLEDEYERIKVEIQDLCDKAMEIQGGIKVVQGLLVESIGCADSSLPVVSDRPGKGGHNHHGNDFTDEQLKRNLQYGDSMPEPINQGQRRRGRPPKRVV